MLKNNENIQGFKQFLSNSKETCTKQIPYYLKWVMNFLQSYVISEESISIQEKINLFADELSKKRNIAEWHVAQARKATSIICQSNKIIDISAKIIILII